MKCNVAYELWIDGIYSKNELNQEDSLSVRHQQFQAQHPQCLWFPGECLHIHERYLDAYNKALFTNQILRFGPSNHVKSERMIAILITWPENAKLESARPLVRKATISQGGSPRSTEDSIMKIAGETKAIVWHIFRTYRFKQQIHFFQFYNFFYENTIMIYSTAYWELPRLPVEETSRSNLRIVRASCIGVWCKQQGLIGVIVK